MEDLQMEHGFLKAPWEVLVRNFRAGHKPVAKDLEVLSNAVNQLLQKHQTNSTSTQQQPMDIDQQQQTSSVIQQQDISALQTKLRGLKRKLEQTRLSDEQCILKCQHRLAHLHARTKSENPPTPSFPSNTPLPFGLPACNPDPSASTTTNKKNVNIENKMEDVQASKSSTPSKRSSPDSPSTSPTAASTDTKNNKEKQKQKQNPIPNYDDFSIDSSSTASTELQSRWERVCLNRALVDYMLREGMYDTANQLSKTHGLEHIVDSDIFRESRVVIEALRKRDCKEGLRWCFENKRRLQKVDSKLEFRLRCQEFVELARAGRKKDAINYMRKYLSFSITKSISNNNNNNSNGDRFIDIQRFMALLIFDPNTNCQPYKDMYGEHKWNELETAFKYDNYRLHGLTKESTVEILLKAGLASLKTRKCATQDDKKKNCPTCVEPYVSLAQSLPRSRHENSILVCSISGKIMDENNPPMALPNGNVYSLSALTNMADENDGAITDPRTKDKARIGDLRKCFIM